MYNHSIKVLENQLTTLQKDYKLICIHSGFQVKEPENAEPDIIKAITRIHVRMDDINNGLKELELAKKFHLSHENER